jgi:hypothetical protein
MKRFFVLLLALTFLAFPFQAKAYLTEEWTKECGYVSFTDGFFFLHGLRLYSQANWKEMFDYMGKEICVEGYLERKQGKNIGISYHVISEVEFHAAPEPEIVEEIIPEETAPVQEVTPAEAPLLQTYYGFLVQGNGERTYLQLPNGHNVLLLKTKWSDDFSGPKFFVEGKALVREQVIRSIKYPVVYTYNEYAWAYPEFFDNGDADELELTDEELETLLEILLEELKD